MVRRSAVVWSSIVLFGLTLGCGLFSGSRRATPAPATATKRVTTAGPTQSDRIAAIEKFFNAKLPSKIRDGQLVQVQFGDGNFGPSDFRTYVALGIDIAKLAVWKSAGAPLAKNGAYERPAEAPGAWLSETDFNTCGHYSIDGFSANSGWMVVCDDGRIFVSTFTQ
jgi:hypothetical protein